MVTYNVSLENKVVLVTGAAGFIGANLVKRLLAEFDSIKVIGIDSITEYYDVRLKYERLEELSVYGDRFVFIKDSIANQVKKPGLNKELSDEIWLELKVCLWIRQKKKKNRVGKTAR